MAAEPLNVARLSRLCGMLGSDHEGERSNAASLATRELRRAGLTWAGVIERAFSPAAKPRAPDDATMLREVRAHLRRLSAWEAEFTGNLLAWRGRLTPKQRITLRGIHARVTGAAG